MGTRAIIVFKDSIRENEDTLPAIFQHWDGYPSCVGERLELAKTYAWKLPRFEADDFAAAYVAVSKQPGGGDIRVFTNISECDADFVVEFSSKLEDITVNGMPLNKFKKEND